MKGNPENHWTERWSTQWHHTQALDAASSIWEGASEFRDLHCVDCQAKQISRNCSERYSRKCADSATKQMVYRLKISAWTNQCQYRSASLGEASNFTELPLSSKSLTGTGSYTTRGRDIVNLKWTPWLYQVRTWSCSLLQVSYISNLDSCFISISLDSSMIFLTSHQVRIAKGLEAEGRSAGPDGRTKCVILTGGLYTPDTFGFAEGA